MSMYETLDLETLFARPDATFVLKMTNDSLSGDHISEGDYVVLERRECRDGEIAVVLILDSGEATLRHVFFDGKSIRLATSNPAYPDKHVASSACKIQGVLCGVLRSYATVGRP